MTELLPDHLVLPRRHLLEHVELAGGELQTEQGATQQADRRAELSILEQRRCLLDFVPGELQPQLRGLVDGREEELVAVSRLLGLRLQREQLVGAQVALVVARTGAGKDRLGQVVDCHGGSILRA